MTTIVPPQCNDIIRLFYIFYRDPVYFMYFSDQLLPLDWVDGIQNYTTGRHVISTWMPEEITSHEVSTYKRFATGAIGVTS